MAGFHPDFGNVDRLTKQAVSPRMLPVYRAFLRMGGAVSGRGVDKATTSRGQMVWVIRPEEPGPHPALLWIHGGGLIFGHPLTEMAFAREVSQRFGAIVALPFYRFAPEHPYPTGLEDVYAALEWLARDTGVDPSRVAVGGDSAGGGLAAAVAIAARDRSGPPLRFQLLHEPMLDEATRRAPAPDPDTLRVWSHGINRWAWDAYLKTVEGDIPATASPARLSDAHGLPPAWIGVGTRDLFHDEARAYAERLAAADVRVEFFPLEGGFHGFAQMRPKAAATQGYVERMMHALGAAFET